MAVSGLLGIVGFGVGYVHALLDQGVYDAAPTCKPGASHACRRHADGAVVALGTSSGRSSTSYWVSVAVTDDGTLTAYVDQPVWLKLSDQQPVRVETWNGQLTMIDDAETQNNPDWNVANGRGLVLLSAGVLILGSILIGLWFMRGRGRRPE